MELPPSHENIITGIHLNRKKTSEAKAFPVICADIQRAFDMIDENHNGRISKFELTRAARVLGYNPTLKEAQGMIDAVDADGREDLMM